jgi:hypothetical protein
LLVSAVGASVLTDSGLFPAGDAAVALAAVATGAKEENSAAFAGQAKPLPQNYFVERRHPSSQQEGWTTVVASCQVRTSLLVVTPRRSPKREPSRSNGWVPARLSAFDAHITLLAMLMMIGRTIRACGAG